MKTRAAGKAARSKSPRQPGSAQLRSPKSTASGSPALDAASVLNILSLLWRVHHGLQRISKKMERELSVTGPQRLVVRLLGESPGMTAGDLARTMHLDPGTMSGIVQRLQRDRLVRRAADPHDARRFLLALSPQGRELAARRSGTIEERVSNVLAAMDAGSVKGAERVLESLANALLDG